MKITYNYNLDTFEGVVAIGSEQRLQVFHDIRVVQVNLLQVYEGDIRKTISETLNTIYEVRDLLIVQGCDQTYSFIYREASQISRCERELKRY